jgi:integrase
MWFNKQEHAAPNGTYQIRHYEGERCVYTTVGADLDQAQTALGELTDKLQLAHLNDKLGIGQRSKDNKTIDELKKTFLLKHESIVRYRLTVDDFCKVLAGQNKTLPSQIEESDILTLSRVWEAQGLAAVSRANRYGMLRCFLRHCKIDPGAVIDAGEHTKLRYKPTTTAETYTEAEVAKLLAVATPRHALAWEMFLKLGFRETELTYLEWTNIDWEAKTAIIKFKVGFAPKSRQERAVPIPDSLLTKLVEWRKQNPCSRYILATRNGTPDQRLLKALKDDWRDAGFNCGRCDGCVSRRECENAWLHKFRATYLTRMLDFTNSRNVQVLAGHSSMVITERYLRPSAMPVMQQAANAAWA